MTGEQLKQAQKRLQADQLAWAGKRVELERLVQTANLTLDTVLPKIEKAKAELADLQGKILAAVDDKRQALEVVALIERESEALQAENQRQQDDLVEVKREVADKRAQIDGEMAEYAKAKRAEVDLALVGLRAEAATATNTVDTLTVQIKQKRDELSSLNEAVAENRRQYKAETQQQEAELGILRAQFPEVKAKLADVTDQLHKAKIEHELIASDTSKARIEHENFLKYEDRARKALGVKDSELQERSADLEQSSRHLKAARSFLPPM